MHIALIHIKKSFSHAYFTSLTPPTGVDLYVTYLTNPENEDQNIFHTHEPLIYLQWLRWREYKTCVSLLDVMDVNLSSVEWRNLFWEAEFLNSSSRNSIRALTLALFHFSSSVFVLSVLFWVSGATTGPEFMHLLQQVVVFPMYRSAPARENISSSTSRVPASPELQQSHGAIRTRHVPLFHCYSSLPAHTSSLQHIWFRKLQIQVQVY